MEGAGLRIQDKQMPLYSNYGNQSCEVKCHSKRRFASSIELRNAQLLNSVVSDGRKYYWRTGRFNVKTKAASTYSKHISQNEVSPIYFVASMMKLCSDQPCQLCCDLIQTVRNNPISSKQASDFDYDFKLRVSGIPLKSQRNNLVKIVKSFLKY